MQTPAAGDIAERDNAIIRLSEAKPNGLSYCKERCQSARLPAYTGTWIDMEAMLQKAL